MTVIVALVEAGLWMKAPRKGKLSRESHQTTREANSRPPVNQTTCQSYCVAVRKNNPNTQSGCELTEKSWCHRRLVGINRRNTVSHDNADNEVSSFLDRFGICPIHVSANMFVRSPCRNTIRCTASRKPGSALRSSGATTTISFAL